MKRQICKHLLVVAALVLLAGCDNDSSDDSDTPTDNGMEPMDSTLESIGSNSPMSEPVPVEPVSLQVELNQISDATDPVPVQPGDTVASILQRAQSR